MTNSRVTPGSLKNEAFTVASLQGCLTQAANVPHHPEGARHG